MTGNDIRTVVYDVVCAIPPGRVTSYGAIARAIGAPHHARLVGRVMAGCCDVGIPAQRVVDSAGRLSGRIAFGPGRMEALLEAEGVFVANSRVRNFRKVFWDPLKELGF
ncbi:MAG: MGMT family protein [Rikenellaceae bacterium]|nr:MGMT family protein [Rikenellaceae bacterium]